MPFPTILPFSIITMSDQNIQRNTNQINNALNAIQKKSKSAHQAQNSKNIPVCAKVEDRDYTIYVTEEGEKISTVERAVKSVRAPATF